MTLAVIYLIGPIGLYLLLAALPPGRLAVGAFAALALALLALWAGGRLGWEPWTGDRVADAWLMAALALWTLAVVLAGVVQAARPRLAARGRLVYPMAVVAVLAVLLLTLAPMLG